jgi:hypothetical protein
MKKVGTTVFVLMIAVSLCGYGQQAGAGAPGQLLPGLISIGFCYAAVHFCPVSMPVKKRGR